MSGSLNERSFDKSAAEKSVLSVLESVRRSASALGKQIVDDISESGL